MANNDDGNSIVLVLSGGSLRLLVLSFGMTLVSGTVWTLIKRFGRKGQGGRNGE